MGYRDKLIIAMCLPVALMVTADVVCSEWCACACAVCVHVVAVAAAALR